MHRLLISPFHDPFVNLALENAFLQEISGPQPLLFLYVNDPAVVLGRFQNPWAETDPSALEGVSLVRRQSGGGTVFHDRGNLNFSFIASREAFHKETNLEAICRVMASAGAELRINERHDLTTEHEGKVYKVSGSAFRHKKDRSFHHGTLLIRTDRALLKRSITPAPGRRFLKVGGTASHRSRVINLGELHPDLTLQSALACFIRAGKERAGLSYEPPLPGFWEALARSESVLAEAALLRSEEWILGKTPPFQQDVGEAFPERAAPVILTVKKGVIGGAEPPLENLAGLPYGSPETEPLLRERLEGSAMGGVKDETFRRLFRLIR